MPTYTIQSASQKKHFPSKGNYSAANVVSLKLADSDGKVVDAEWMQRDVSEDATEAAGQVPAAGSTMEFDLTEGQYGLEARKPRPAGRSGGWSGGGNRSFQKSPQDQASIVRQHSQHMAILWAGHVSGIDGVEKLKKVIDWFEADAQEAAAKAKAKADTETATPPQRKFLADILDGSGKGIRKPTEGELKAALTAAGVEPTSEWREKLTRAQASGILDVLSKNRQEQGAFSNGDKGPTPDPDNASDIPSDDAFAEFEEIIESEQKSDDDPDRIPF